MFQRFTSSARAAVTAAQEEARQLDQPLIGTEHLLIALAGDGLDPSARALRSAGTTAAALRYAARSRSADHLDADALALLGIDLDQVRRAAEERFGPGALDVPPGRHAPRGHLPFSAPAKQALAAAVRQSTVLRTGSISTGHLLLGLLSDDKSAAVELLQSCGADIVSVRAAAVALLQSAAA